MCIGLIQITAVLALSSSAMSPSRVIITEIMYNPASNERQSETEWVEIANVGAEPIEIKDWRLDDEDKADWGKFSCTLGPGDVVVLINGDAVTEAQFRAAWDDSPEGSAAASYLVVPVKWGGISNNPSVDNEVLQLRNEKDDVVCEVKREGEWPIVKGAGGPSIFLTDLSATNLSDGKLWKSSIAGEGARLCKITEVFDKEDCGSPGTLPGAPTTVAANPADPKTEEKPAKPDEKIDY